jgi:NAD(P)-dependent dehydrogenase (short-subunit alcohol dehydrogenase family)
MHLIDNESLIMTKTWFITGASRGFGALIAAQALERGHNVVATARAPEAVTTALGERPNLLTVALDVTAEKQAVVAAQTAVECFGGIDILVNNAGFGLLGAVEEATADEVERIYATNVFGLLAVTRAVLPHMRRQRRGHILNMSSIGGYAASAGWGVYGSTKFAIEGLTEALALELKPLGIYATIVERGFFRTDFLDARSLLVSPATIEDYKDTAGAMRSFASGASHAEPGDPVKLAKALMVVADMPEPPLRIPFGSDTIRRIETKNAFVARELTRWRALSVSTDTPPRTGAAR